MVGSVTKYKSSWLFLIAIGMYEGRVIADAKAGIRFDCLTQMSKGSSKAQDCFNMSELSLRVDHAVNDKVNAFVKIDPFGTPVSSLSSVPRGAWKALPTYMELGSNFIDDYGLFWKFRSHLTLGIENFSGVVQLPNMSKLALASRFQDSGWKQTAITAKYELAPLSGIDVKLAIGSGEGESMRNLDPQQYGGIEINANLVEGVFLKVGLSFDGNNVGSEAYSWLYNSESELRGFSTERQAIAFGLNGKLEKLRGLRLSVGWQKTSVTDLDKDTKALADTLSDRIKHPIDVNNLLVESMNSAIEITRNVIDFNAAYRILDTYELAVAYEQRQVDTDTVKAFVICSQITASGCAPSSEVSNKLTQSAYTIGVSHEIAPNVKMLLEYHNAYYDKVYQSYNFEGSGGEKTKSWEVINARVAYNW
jgi:hypothetical protein